MKIKYSALVSDARGKLNGSVASKNRYGQYFRNKVSPVNRNTVAQQEVRSLFGTISTQWRTVGQEVRDGWAARASTSDFIDQFGDAHTLQPNAYFIKANMLTRSNGLGPARIPLENFTFNADGLHIEVHSTGTAILIQGIAASNWQQGSPSTLTAVLFATPSVSPGRKFVKNDYRKVAVLSGDGTIDNPIDFSGGTAEWSDMEDLYIDKFGHPNRDEVVGIRLVFVTSSGTAHVAAERLVVVGS